VVRQRSVVGKIEKGGSRSFIGRLECALPGGYRLSVTRSPGLTSEEALMSADLDHREARLNEPHVLPLMELVRKLRKRLADIAKTNGDLDPPGVPNVDPNDDGVNARALFFLATPGQRRVRSRQTATTFVPAQILEGRVPPHYS
jgi:hypothetical protein